MEVLVLRDLARLLPESPQMRSDELFNAWSENWNGLGADDDQAVAAIDNAINDLRKDIVKVLESLD